MRHYVNYSTGTGAAGYIIDDTGAFVPAPAREKSGAPANIDTSRMNVREGYVNTKTNAPRASITDDIASAIPLDCDYAKGYKIYVQPKNDADAKFVLVGYVLVSPTGARRAIDVFGARHNIVQAARLREKHVRSAFHIDARFTVKQICIQMDVQRYKTSAHRAPRNIGAPVLKRPKIG